eukprot:9053098-Pyramimonas_sp.AAC.1
MSPLALSRPGALGWSARSGAGDRDRPLDTREPGLNPDGDDNRGPAGTAVVTGVSSHALRWRA